MHNSFTAGGRVNGIAAMENCMVVPQKVKKQNYHMICHLDIKPKELKAESQIDIGIHMFIALSFTIVKRFQ